MTVNSENNSITQAHTFTLINPLTGNLAFKLFAFEDNPFEGVQRLSYYSLIWVKKGEGKITSDFSEYAFGENHLFAFAPYQPFMLSTTQAVAGVVVQFHPDFFCIHKHQQEVACNGVLFNNIYQPPFVIVERQNRDYF